jgi:DNA-binding response OmpR family regulator
MLFTFKLIVMANIKVLFIDDDIELGKVVSYALRDKGIDVYFQNTLAGAKSTVIDVKPDAIILDIGIGAEDGISYIPQILDIAPQTPIIVASSHTDYTQIERAFNAHAVDFVKKPYDADELALYIKRNLRETVYHTITIGDMTLNTGTHQLLRGDKVIKRLSGLEYKLLKLLANNSDEVVTRTDIEKELWDTENSATNSYTISNLIMFLRKIISSSSSVSIELQNGVGYCLCVKTNQNLSQATKSDSPRCND